MEQNLRDEIESLLSREARPLERILNRLLDEARRLDDRPLRNEASLLKNRFLEIEEEERKLGADRRPQRAEIKDVALNLADKLDLLAAEPPPAPAPPPPQSLFSARPAQPKTTADSDVVVAVNGITKHLTGGGSAFALENVSLELHRGELLAVMGPNGSGKSTLMRILAGELAPDSGSIEYPAISRDPEDWIQIKKQLAYVSQFPKPWSRPLLQVLRFTAAVAGYTGDENEVEVQYAIARLGLSSHVSKSYTQLSGGYRTRFSLARCLLMRPALLLLDEPLAHLDVMAQSAFLRDLRDVSRSARFGVVLTSQHIYEAEAVSDKVVVLDGGRKVFSGAVAELEDPDAATIEVSCLADEASVAAILGGEQLSSPMFNRYVVSVPAGTTCNQLVAKFSEQNITVTYCRDWSRSSRRFMKEERP